MSWWALIVALAAFAVGVMLGEKVARRAVASALDLIVPRAVEETVEKILKRAGRPRGRT